VKENDILYHLGDFSFGGWMNVWRFRSQINCKNIHLILGNHDYQIKKNKFLHNLERMDDGEIFEIQSPNNFKRLEKTKKYSDVFLCDLFSSVNEKLTITIEKQKMILCHFPIEDWEDCFTGAWHLFGHCHGNLKEETYRRMDVGLDSNELKVLSFEQVKEIMEKRIDKKHIR
jgi:calcineurin-like phosphoesterase family protein